MTILDVIKDNLGVREMLLRLNISKQNLQYYINSLKKLGIITLLAKGIWGLSPEFKDKNIDEIIGFIDSKKDSKKISSLGLKKANLHALNINIPISEGSINLKEMGGYESKLNNWVAQYKRIPSLGLTLKNNNNNSISVFVWSREIFDYLAIPSLCHVVVHTVCSYFKEKGVILDYFGWRVTTLHLMVKNEDLDSVLNKGLKIEVLLNRQTERISENDITQEAKAWVDKSPYGGVETNDVAYYKNYILMPENMAKMTIAMTQLTNELAPTIKDLNYNMKTHISVLKGIEKAFKKFNEKLSQTSLTKYF